MINQPGRITSRQNPAAKFVRLLSQRKNREVSGQFVVEGIRLLEEARDASFTVNPRFKLEMVMFAPEVMESGRGTALLQSLAGQGVEVIPVSASVMEFVSDTASPAGVLGVVRRLAPTDGGSYPEAVGVSGIRTTGLFILILDRIQDPGNLGTLLRTAEAAGAAEVWTTVGTTDCFSPKVVRATMGSIFRVPLRVNVNPSDIAFLSSRGMKIFGAARGRGRSFFKTDFNGEVAIVLGSEAHGLSPEVERCVTDWVQIPMKGEVDSLNVAVAGALVLFETARQQRLLEHDFRDVL